MHRNNIIRAVVLSCLTFGLTVSEPTERRLIDNLLTSYSTNSRPVQNASLTLRVHIDFEVRTILDFDEQNQVITVVGLKTLKWNDADLRWNARQFDGIKRLHFDAKRIWTPDTVLINAASPPVPIHSTSLLISNKGEVKFVSPFIYKSMCKTKLKSNIQKCPFEFSSWTYSGDEIDLRMSTGVIDVSRFVPHHEWALEPTSANRKEESYPCCTEVYPKITYTLNLARRVPIDYNKNATDSSKKPKSGASNLYSSYHLMLLVFLSSVLVLSNRNILSSAL